MLNDLMSTLEKITFYQYLGLWVIIFLFMVLNKVSSYIDARLELLKAQAELLRQRSENEAYAMRGRDYKSEQ